MKALLAAVALLAAISTASAEDKTLVIGCSLPLSGRMVGFGQPIQQGMQLAVDSFNASGQLPGAHFVLACIDSLGDPKETVNIATPTCSFRSATSPPPPRWRRRILTRGRAWWK
jgi:outer membrane PBP1 activator LpoA protein